MTIPGAAEQRQMALHDLLDRYLISREDEPEAYRRITLHEGYLKGWFAERPQWRILNGRGIYRLERMPSLVVPERGLPRLRSPLAYACLCWVLWFAETMTSTARDWFVISELAERVATAAKGRFTLAERSHREALVQALQLLVDLGGLLLRDGDADRWVAGQGSIGEEPEVMYEFAENAPRLLANFTYESLAVLAAGDPGAKTAMPTGETAPPLARAWRAVLLGPVFWRGDDPEAFALLEERQEQVQRDLEAALGWQLQLNPEYARIWRMTTARHAGSVLLNLYPDPGMPMEDQHTRYLYHPILLLLDRCRERVAAGRWRPDEAGAVPVPFGELHDLMADLRGEYRRYWGSELGAVSLTDLVRAVLTEMRRMALLRGPDQLQRCYLLPAGAGIRGRYGTQANGGAGDDAEESKEGTPGPVQSTLFQGLG
ncbi:hypothetical protein SY88_10205 [Clostridiales bacterium PH28_bin88]|nr:hypothetical protein SY88_10205 [Clostridiales bacterium PH28_bin88]